MLVDTDNCGLFEKTPWIGLRIDLVGSRQEYVELMPSRTLVRSA